MNKKAHGLVEVETSQLPNWLAIPLVILVCITLLVVILFLSVVIYSCYKGNCNGYYGVPIWFYRTGPVLGFSSQVCYSNGVPVNCSELNYTAKTKDVWSDGTYLYTEDRIYYMNGTYKGKINVTDVFRD